MIRNFTLLLLLAFCCYSPVAAASAVPPKSASVTSVLQARLDSLLTDPMFEQTQLGLYIYDLTADSAIYKHNHRQLMRPASNQKVVTAIAALDYLGGNYHYATSLYTHGSLCDSLLQGDIFLRGGLDPRLDSTDVAAFAQALFEKGVRRIEGNLFLDASLKDSLLYGWGWCWDDDNPKLSPLLYEGRPSLADRMIDALTETGIDLCGVMCDSLLPDSAELLLTRSHSIDQILMPMMKDSDNLYAESLFYQMGAKSGEAFPGRDQSIQPVHRLIKRVGLNPADYRIADGSGLSLYNYVTPELLGKILRYAYRNKRIYNHLLPSLPVAGEDGTLRKRMRKGYAHGKVFAKTGTVTGISTLSGYLTAPNGHRLCFSIMNQGLRRVATGRDFQDRLCEALLTPADQPWPAQKQKKNSKR